MDRGRAIVKRTESGRRRAGTGGARGTRQLHLDWGPAFHIPYSALYMANHYCPEPVLVPQQPYLSEPKPFI
ncbi:Beta-2-Syntrophin [Manis pentadactyla]|nr:Beta-2-Syntrophin [Manis pentadactyla]